MNEQAEIQDQFFQYLIAFAGTNTVLNKTGEILNLGKGAVYKRINGTTALTSAEMVKLAIAFEVSLDNIFQKESYMGFFHPFWKGDEKTTGVDFMDRFAFYLKPVTKHKYSHMTSALGQYTYHNRRAHANRRKAGKAESGDKILL